MLFEKSYDTFLEFLVETIWKYFEKFPFEITGLKYCECHLLLYSNMSLFCFLALVHPLNHNFLNETTVWEKSIEALLNQELNNFYSTETCQIDKSS